MIEVKLRDNFRMFDDFDTDFVISAGEKKVLPERDLKAYQIKQYLYHGHLKVVTGEILLMIKGFPCYISAEFPGKAYIRENSVTYFERELDLDVLNKIETSELPAGVKEILDSRELNPTEPEEVVEEELEEVVEEVVEEPVLDPIAIVDSDEVVEEPEEVVEEEPEEEDVEDDKTI